MRYGIFSDIHANLEALEAAMSAFKREAIDRYFCAGDLVGYGANPKECIEKVESFTGAVVAGNHDWASIGLFSENYFNANAKDAIFWTRKNLDDESRYFLGSLKLVYKNEDFTLVHGTLDNPGAFDYMADSYTAGETFRVMETDICFIGHTHVAGIFTKGQDERIYYQEQESVYIKENDKYIVNLGSIGQPRDGDPRACYCTYDTDKKEVRIKRADYDTQAARRKIISAGLPQFLGDRLLIGQ
jgi:predicted phosphodiesterase